MTTFKDAKVGDTVTRMLCGELPMELRVTDIDDKLIHCGSWTFDRITGLEVDDVLEWPRPDGSSGSHLL